MENRAVIFSQPVTDKLIHVNKDYSLSGLNFGAKIKGQLNQILGPKLKFDKN